MGVDKIELSDLSNDSLIFVDASAFNEFPNKDKQKLNLDEKINFYKDTKYFLQYLLDSIESEKSNFYFTEKIFEEITRPDKSKPIFSPFKRPISREEKKVNKLRHLIEGNINKTSLLINLTKKHGRVYEPDNSEKTLYSISHDKYCFMKEVFGISEPDFEFVLMGVLLSRLGKKIKLLTNDSGIARSFRYFGDNGLINENIDIFARDKYPTLKRWNFLCRCHWYEDREMVLQPTN